MQHKGENCYSVTKAELLAALRRGNVLWISKFGPHVFDAGKQLHPRRDTINRMIAAGELVESPVANATQRSAGINTWGLVDAKAV
jgi:hypothetical protein